MPQPTAAPTAQEAPKTVPTKPPAANASDAEKQIWRAKLLAAEDDDLRKRIDSNRQYLRLMDKNETLDEDQGAWLDNFYPLKAKDSKRDSDAVKATREAKLAAVKEVQASQK